MQDWKRNRPPQAAGRERCAGRTCRTKHLVHGARYQKYRPRDFALSMAAKILYIRGAGARRVRIGQRPSPDAAGFDGPRYEERPDPWDLDLLKPRSLRHFGGLTQRARYHFRTPAYPAARTCTRCWTPRSAARDQQFAVPSRAGACWLSTLGAATRVTKPAFG
jgi:hypothetical protein